MKKKKPKPLFEPYTDETILDWGMNRGKKLGDISAHYFVYIYENFTNLDSRLRIYIENNMDAFNLEIKNYKK